MRLPILGAAPFRQSYWGCCCCRPNASSESSTVSSMETLLRARLRRQTHLSYFHCLHRLRTAGRRRSPAAAPCHRPHLVKWWLPHYWWIAVADHWPAFVRSHFLLSFATAAAAAAAAAGSAAFAGSCFATVPRSPHSTNWGYSSKCRCFLHPPTPGMALKGRAGFLAVAFSRTALDIGLRLNCSHGGRVTEMRVLGEVPFSGKTIAN